MKAGWKNRIDERRYFDEKKARNFDYLRAMREAEARSEFWDMQVKIRKEMEKIQRAEPGVIVEYT